MAPLPLPESSGKAWGKEYMTNTVHELRTPLTTIMASLDMLNEGYATTPEEIEAFAEQAIAASHHMMFLINDLLDWSAIDAGMLRINMGTCYPNNILEDARRIIEPMAIVQNIELVIERLEQDCPISGDVHRILQVIFNLLGNALKFAAESRQVGLKAIKRDAGVLFEIWDEGAGVDPQDVDKVFGRFRQSQRTDVAMVASNGIGLHVSKELVEQMGGTIGYRARAGGGSVFFFNMQMGSVSAQETGHGEDQPKHCTVEPSSCGPKPDDGGSSTSTSW